MVIQHNMPSLNALRKTNDNNKRLSGNLEKLSSGFRINRSADDAAGLAISEKMRGQIRGLAMAESNITSGISLIKTTDGAMSEVHDMMQRMRELVVQGANGTYEKNEYTRTGTCGKVFTITSEPEREMIQLEIDHLMEEIDDLSRRAVFNTIKVLQGDTKLVEFSPEAVVNTDGRPGSVLGGLPAWVTIGNTSSTDHMEAGTLNGTPYATTGSVDFSKLTADNVEELLYGGFQTTCCTCNARLSFMFNDKGDNDLINAGNGLPVASFTGGFSCVVNVDITGITSGDQLVTRIMDILSGSNKLNHFTEVAVDSCATDVLILYDNRPTQSAGTGTSEQGMLRPGVFYDGTYLPDFTKLVAKEIPQKVNIQAGANRGEKIEIQLTTVNTTSLELRSKSGTSLIGVTPQERADRSISLLDEAINILSGKRAVLGATQNRLEHALTNAGNMRENQTASESVIRDLDMAKEMMEFTKNNIILQASQSMLAQANQIPQGVLSLLR